MFLVLVTGWGEDHNLPALMGTLFSYKISTWRVLYVAIYNRNVIIDFIFLRRLK